MSPSTLLCRRLGNSFEMATLLVSVLLANGFRRSYVVNGYASREVVNNDQQRVECPYMPGPIVVSERPHDRREMPFKLSTTYANIRSIRKLACCVVFRA